MWIEPMLESVCLVAEGRRAEGRSLAEGSTAGGRMQSQRWRVCHAWPAPPVGGRSSALPCGWLPAAADAEPRRWEAGACCACCALQLDMYYNGFCNSVLWPLFHYVPLNIDSWLKMSEHRAMQLQWQAYQVCALAKRWAAVGRWQPASTGPRSTCLPSRDPLARSVTEHSVTERVDTMPCHLPSPTTTHLAGGQPALCRRGAGELPTQRHHVRASPAAPPRSALWVLCSARCGMTALHAATCWQSRGAFLHPHASVLVVLGREQLAIGRNFHEILLVVPAPLVRALGLPQVGAGLPPDDPSLAAQGCRAQDEGRLLPAHALPLVR